MLQNGYRPRVFIFGNEMPAIIPEVNYLLLLIEKHYGRHIATSTDFESLSVQIEHETGELLSSSTLKRLFGYVSMKPIPRKSTLDILARYIGKKDFQQFREELRHNEVFSSTFFSTKIIHTSDLDEGETLTIGWAPDRLVKLEYLGNYEFTVTDSINSHLLKGDRFFQTDFMLGYPLYISRILRNGEYTPSYIAGMQNGLNVLEQDGI